MKIIILTTKKLSIMAQTIITSELGEQGQFISGGKYHFIEWAKCKGIEFKKGVSVKWFCEDDRKNYKGEIEWLILRESGEVEASISHPALGRIPVNELKLSK